MGDDDEAWVLGVEGFEAVVEVDGLLERLVADGVAAFDLEATEGGGFEEQDGIVAGEFVFQGGVEVGEETVGVVGPVGGAVDGAAVAEEDAVGVAGSLYLFEVFLDVVDGAL